MRQRRSEPASREPPSASVSNAEGMAKHFSNAAVTPVVPKLFVVMTINYSEYGGRHSVRNRSTKGASLWQRCLLLCKHRRAGREAYSCRVQDLPQSQSRTSGRSAHSSRGAGNVCCALSHMPRAARTSHGMRHLRAAPTCSMRAPALTHAFSVKEGGKSVAAPRRPRNIGASRSHLQAHPIPCNRSRCHCARSHTSIARARRNAAHPKPACAPPLPP
mmetsp:Transcript_51978/g.153386  ORF Transcript_51978/g.153386 Transcript_51978/m.153386 type:complete len:217 (-) Transcript_51978:119-769(-)